MPRKTPSKVVPVSVGQVVKITCPACQSEVSSDGKTLHKKSANLEELLESGANLEEIEKGVKGLEDKHATAQARVTELETQLKLEKEKFENAQRLYEAEKRKNGWW